MTKTTCCCSRLHTDAPAPTGDAVRVKFPAPLSLKRLKKVVVSVVGLHDILHSVLAGDALRIVPILDADRYDQSSHPDFCRGATLTWMRGLVSRYVTVTEDVEAGLSGAIAALDSEKVACFAILYPEI